MDAFLKILGTAFLGIIAFTLILIVVIVLVVRAKLKKFVGDLGKMAEGVGTTDWTTTPARIHLQPRDSLSWNNLAAAETAIKAFQDAGFSDSGSFEIEEMPGLRLRGFALESEGLRGVVYEREPVGVWTDCVFYAADGTSITVSNAPAGKELDHRPGHDKVYLTESDATTLIFKARDEATGKVPAQESPEGFAARFEKAYADEMDWRNSRGGPTMDEIKRLAAKSGLEVSDDILEAQFEGARVQAAEGVDLALRERYLAQNNLSALEWEAKRNRIAFIHETLTPSILESRIYEWELLDYDDEEESELKFDTANFDPRREFAAINSKVSAGQRFEKIGEMDEPVKADVYMAPREIHFD